MEENLRLTLGQALYEDRLKALRKAYKEHKKHEDEMTRYEEHRKQKGERERIDQSTTRSTGKRPEVHPANPTRPRYEEHRKQKGERERIDQSTTRSTGKRPEVHPANPTRPLSRHSSQIHQWTSTIFGQEGPPCTITFYHDPRWCPAMESSFVHEWW